MGNKKIIIGFTLMGLLMLAIFVMFGPGIEMEYPFSTTGSSGSLERMPVTVCHTVAECENIFSSNGVTDSQIAGLQFECSDGECTAMVKVEVS